MWFRPGEADRGFLRGEIAPVLGYAQSEPPRTWDILTQFYFDPGLGEDRRVERLLPAAAEAGAPMRIRVLYLAAGGSSALARAELSRLARDMERYFPPLPNDGRPRRDAFRRGGVVVRIVLREGDFLR